MPLEDGTNAEGEDISTPLPSHWKGKPESLKRIVLCGTHASPATCKTRALLNLAGVRYERKFGKCPGSSYRKYPVVILDDGGGEHGDNERQINDSHIIYKFLSPILFPDEDVLSDDDIEIERTVTFGLMLSCEREAFADPDCVKRWFRTAGLTGMTGFFIRNLAPLSIAKKGADKISANNPNLRKPVDYCRDLKVELDKRGTPYFGGSKAGPLDESIYGALCVWAPGDDKTMPFTEKPLKESGLDGWYGRMADCIPNMWELKGCWPFYT